MCAEGMIIVHQDGTVPINKIIHRRKKLRSTNVKTEQLHSLALIRLLKSLKHEMDEIIW
jgi:hypothetical protein